MPLDLRDLTYLPVKQSRIGVLNPCQGTALDQATYLDSTTHLVKDIMGDMDSKLEVHETTMETGRAGGIARKDREYKRSRGEVEEHYTGNQKQCINQVAKCLDHWTSVTPHTPNKYVLVKDKFQDMILLQYNIIPKDLLQSCNGCSTKHSL
eukprot:6028207-Ditylum_brightwellii.AAC.2